MSGHLDAPGKLTVHDYEYLKGNEVYWPRWGAAFVVVSEWSHKWGYGTFGKPTESGKKAMKKYELEHRL